MLGLLLLLLYVNELSVNLKSQTRLFADDALVHGVIIFNEDTLPSSYLNTTISVRKLVEVLSCSLSISNGQGGVFSSYPILR